MDKRIVGAIALGITALLLLGVIVANPWGENNDNAPPATTEHQMSEEDIASHIADGIKAYAATNPPVDANAVASAAAKAAVEEYARTHPSPTPSTTAPETNTTPPSNNSTSYAPPVEVVDTSRPCVLEGTPSNFKPLNETRTVVVNCDDWMISLDSGLKRIGGEVVFHDPWQNRTNHDREVAILSITGNLSDAPLDIPVTVAAGNCAVDSAPVWLYYLVGAELDACNDWKTDFDAELKKAGWTVTFNNPYGNTTKSKLSILAVSGSSGSGSGSSGSGSGSGTTGTFTSAQCDTVVAQEWVVCAKKANGDSGKTLDYTRLAGNQPSFPMVFLDENYNVVTSGITLSCAAQSSAVKIYRSGEWASSSNGASGGSSITTTDKNARIAYGNINRGTLFWPGASDQWVYCTW